jgi:hypothetical protein
MTEDAFDNVNPTWSRDGRWIYFRSTRGERPQIWRIPADGGDAIQITQNGGRYARESWDGEYLYYTDRRGLRTSIWRVSLKGGDEEKILDEVAGAANWALGRSGIYHATSEIYGPSSSQYTIWYYHLETAESREVYRGERRFNLGSLFASPDDEWLIFDGGFDVQRDIMLMENFR